MEAKYSVRGVQDILEVHQNRLTITPKGVLGVLNKGLKGSKEIPFSSIVAVQFKKASAFLNGYLQFTILGGNENRRGLMAATKDENSFLFRSNQNEVTEEIREYIAAAIRDVKVPNGFSTQNSIANELAELSKLKEQGALTDEEFQSAKRKLLE